MIRFLERKGPVARKYLHDEGKHRCLSRARFYSRDEVLELLRRTGLSVAGIDSRAGFCVLAAQKT